MKPRKIAMTLLAAAACGALAGLWVFTQAPAFAATTGGTYYVSPTGSTANDGSQYSPWPSVGHALGKVGGGSTIILEPGTYAPILVPRGYGGASGHPTVIKSQAQWQAVIDGTLNPAVEGLASETPGSTGTTDYTTFDGLKVVQAGTFGINLGGNWNVAQNCWVTGSKHSGIGSWGHSRITIRNNLIEHSGASTKYDHGIYVTGRGLVVTGNVVRHNSACGITVTTQGLARSTVSGNLIYDNLINLFLEGDAGSVAVTNNTLLNTTTNPALPYSIDEIRSYGPNSIAAWSGNRVESSVSGASLDGISSASVADYSKAVSLILPLPPTVPDRRAPAANVTDSGPDAGRQMVVVTYNHNESLALPNIGPDNVVIKGPGGYSAPAQALAMLRMDHTSRTLSVMYYLTPPAGGWTSANNGSYDVYLQANQVCDLAGNYAAAGKLTKSFIIHINPATAQASDQKRNPMSIGPSGPTGLNGPPGPPGRESSGRSHGYGGP